MNQRTKQIIIAVVIIVVAFFGFKMFFAPDNSAATGTLVADSGAARQFVDGQAVLILLNKLSQVSLDDSVFSSPIFKSLVNFGREIPDQVMERANPFAPIGSDGSATFIQNASSTLRVR